jgi:hypothetical protein
VRSHGPLLLNLGKAHAEEHVGSAMGKTRRQPCCLVSGWVPCSSQRYVSPGRLSSLKSLQHLGGPLKTGPAVPLELGRTPEHVARRPGWYHRY